MKRILSTDLETIFNSLQDVINEYDIKRESLISIYFDGAAIMSGSLSDVQARFKEKNKNIYLFIVNINNININNLILVDSVGK